MMEKAVDLELLQGLWKMYLRQKDDEEKAGIDTKADTDRMRALFNMAAAGERLSYTDIEEEFSGGEPEAKPGMCPLCRNTGVHYKHNAQFVLHGRAKRAPAMVVCDCFEGRRLREAIRNGPQRKKRGSRG